MLSNLTKDDRILILSPHLDDAVLSAGGLIDRAVRQGSTVIAGTIFTADAPLDGEPSPLVKELHDWWGLGPHPYEVRRKEDVASMQLLGGDYLHGGLLDSIYRHGSDGKPLYDTRKAVFSPPARNDPVSEPLKAVLSAWVKAVRPTLVLCPLAVGRHVDHVVTVDAAKEEHLRWNAAVYLYEDIPYSTGMFPPNFPDNVPAARARANWATKEPVAVEVDFAAKFAAIMKYKSQIAEIFPNLDPEAELRRYMSSGVAGAYLERFWPIGHEEEIQQ